MNLFTVELITLDGSISHKYDEVEGFEVVTLEKAMASGVSFDSGEDESYSCNDRFFIVTTKGEQYVYPLLFWSANVG